MRDRLPADWQVDLAERHPLESEVAAAIDAHVALVRLTTSTSSCDRLDYQLLGPGERLCELELKAKRRPYQGWSALRPDVLPADLFILDELALRRIVDAGRYGFLLVRDIPGRRWALWSTAELVLATKVRAGRRLATGVERTKGKLLMDLSSAAAVTDTLVGALAELATLVGIIDRRWGDIAPWPWQERQAWRKGEAS
jgi:hypothetical protein